MSANTLIDSGPFHAGEHAVQERMGVREQIEPWARQVVRSFMPDEHLAFYAQLPFVVAAARDEAHRPWVTLLAGAPGFIDAADGSGLDIAAGVHPGDALAAGFEPGSDVGLLGIEFATRRRNRVNGRIASRTAQGFRFEVEQSFGNCPQYIHPREWQAASVSQQGVVEHSDRLSPAAIDWIRSADTLFIASGHRGAGASASFGMDASHRGGERGFVSVLDERTLVLPDYAGNNHYNTIGNLVMESQVGLLFVDFERGSMLQLSGRAAIDWDSAAVAAVPGAQRLINISVESVRVLHNVLPIRWHEKVAERALRVTAKSRESEDVMSVTLEACDGGELADFETGQHLPVELTLSDPPNPQRRTYSLTAAPNGRSYRLGIKREAQGRVSRFVHDVLEAGDVINTGLPAGDFHLRPGSRPVVLVGAGVGVTPLLAMLEVLAAEGEVRQAWMVHGVRDGAHHPFANQVRSLAAGNPRLHTHTAYSRPRAEDRSGLHYNHAGRIDAGMLEALLPSLDVDFYFCGPVTFMAELIQQLSARGVPDAQLSYESFGPAG